MDPDTRPAQEQPAQNTLSFEAFRRIIAEKLQVDETQVRREASFVEDLCADSIQLVELMLHLEEEGIGIPLEEAWEVQTVGDAYRLCQEHALTGG